MQHAFGVERRKSPRFPENVSDAAIGVDKFRFDPDRLSLCHETSRRKVEGGCPAPGHSWEMAEK
ncbi:protein of unknown function [Methylocaldum szegediense]|uniref:Uncharacterized protein n=1 Tax=Methylocaldum szegediense TaxID=73780 RepID=A0ABM9HW17_9GAMM|nr:protein of unknown function [Methylocaldum szegediense]